MNQATTTQMQIPPEVVKYLAGSSQESRQFDFLLGNWSVAGSAFKPDGSLLRQYSANWDAHQLNDGRMIMDDFKIMAPSGQFVSSFVTLRTWCESTMRWEITGLSAFQPSMNAQWYGNKVNEEMHLIAIGKDPAGIEVQTRIRFFDIEPSSFCWESHMSRDGGITWNKSAELRATRKS
ncbi:MAG: hypothetical protein V4843_22110 [Pseudomonadota bacterium]